MIINNPTLQIKKLVVSASGQIAFSEEFHSGLNILRGENSSGKSTIMDFLFYGLGGDLNNWREAALECDEITLEVMLNSGTITIKRTIEDSSRQPMRIFVGPLEEANLSATEGWSIYPYTRHKDKESFSQVLFRWLNLPQVPGHDTSNITMHQLLRLLYADQMTPTHRLLRVENFDNPLIRRTVGEMLCGAYNVELFDAQIRLRDAEKELSAFSNELKSILASLGHIKHSLTMEWLDSEKKATLDEISDVQNNILHVEEKLFRGEISDGLSLHSQNQAYENLQSIQVNLSEKQQNLDSLILQIRDSEQYILSLTEKFAALQDASSTADTLKGISFIYCPACFAPIDDINTHHHCQLCKSPFDEDRALSRILLLKNDVGLQLKQSKELQRLRHDEVQKSEKELHDAKANWESASRRYHLVNKIPSTHMRTQLRDLHRKAGYLEKQVEELNGQSSLIKRISSLSSKKQELNTEIENLKGTISAHETRQKKRLANAYTAVAENVKWFLKNDLARQDTFSKAESVEFDFEKDTMSVNRESFFSASSMVYMKNSFLVSFWKASLEDQAFRFPRFLLMDTMEDKGMEPERSHNFQNLLKEISESSEVEHQLIYATSMISPELENSPYVVGRFFTHDKRTLELHY